MPAPLRVVLVSLPFRYFPFGDPRSANYARPPLGIAYLAAYLREHAAAPVDVRCLDLLTEPQQGPERVLERILGLAPDVVGFSVMTATQPLTAWLARELKARRPSLWVVAGGPHVSALPAEPMPGVDARVLGEGEAAFLDVIHENVLGGSARPVAGTLLRQADGTLAHGAERPVLADLDALPFPARDLLPGGAYFHTFPYRGVHAFTTMMTSRGCPHACNFCLNETAWHRRVRVHSVDRVMAEIDHVQRTMGVDLVFFDDDTFTTSRERTAAIAARIARDHPRLRWICHTRVDAVDDELVREMARSGCLEAQVGIEAGNPDVLASTGKGIDLDQAARALVSFRRHGINVWATFVLGHEADTRETLDETVAAAIRLNPTYASFIVLLPFPGTAVFDSYRDKGYLLTEDWADYTWHGRPVFATPRLTPDDLVRARARANLAFYLRPQKLAELAWHTLRAGSLREMRRNVAAWRSLVSARRFTKQGSAQE